MKQEMPTSALAAALWRIYRRRERPRPWAGGGNLPWDDPAFSRRMLREHLDPSHGAASRPPTERERQLQWIWWKMALHSAKDLLDVTCGPGLYAVPLARRGVRVTGVDFGPAAIAHARDLAREQGMEEHCQFVKTDVREADLGQERYDAALFLYGQLAVFPREEARQLLRQVAVALRPGGRLCLELLNQEKVDKDPSTWWFSDDSGLWSDAPFLSLGERFWFEEEKLSCERYYTLHLESGELEEILLCDQTYAVREMAQLLKEVGFAGVDVHPAWDGLNLSDADEWVVYVAQK